MRVRNNLRNGAVIWLVACGLFAFYCAVTTAFYSWRQRRDDDRLLAAMNLEALHTLPARDARAVVAQFVALGGRALTRPWLGYSEAPYHGRGVNIDAFEPLPIRRTPSGRGANTRPITVWLFGGSTALGYGVPDDQTIAEHLQEALRPAFHGSDIRVVNHGHLGFFSSQEAALFAWLLRSGQRADIAVFLDGYNDSLYAADTPTGEQWVAARSSQNLIVTPRLAPVRMALAVARRGRRQTHALEWPPRDRNEIERRSAITADRLLANMNVERGVARAFGMRVLFILQPTPFDGIERSPADPAVRRVFPFFPENPIIAVANRRIKASVTQADFVDMTEEFKNDRFRDTYIDVCHYGDAASRKLAEAIAAEILRCGY